MNERLHNSRSKQVWRQRVRDVGLVLQQRHQHQAAKNRQPPQAIGMRKGQGSGNEGGQGEDGG